jgi:hypothetical protein
MDRNEQIRVKLRAVALVLAVSALLPACGMKTTWRKPGGTPEQFARDRQTCLQETVVPYTKLVPTTGWTSRARVAGDPYAACLRARGYERGSLGLRDA